jgi:hypothetical protein
MMFALRVPPAFAATVKLIDCELVPLPGTTVIHGGTPLVVQAQPATVFTAKELPPPLADEL